MANAFDSDESTPDPGDRPPGPAAEALAEVPAGLVWVSDQMPGIRRRRRGIT